MDNLVDENMQHHALKEQKEVAFNYRNIGIGYMGITDLFVKFGFKYGDINSQHLINTISNFIFKYAVKASSSLALYKGSFPKYTDDVFNSTIIKNHFSNDEIKVLKKQGLRNCALLSIAPTGSIGTMLNISTGCEPYFALSYNRKTISLNKEDTLYQVFVKEADYYIKNIDKTLPEYFIESKNINYLDRIIMQSIMQNHIDTAISSTINLPSSTTVEDIKTLYLQAWESGLKGVTIYVDGSRDPILSTKKEKPKEIIDRGAPKRPKDLEADFYSVKVKGEQFIVLIGLFENKPYEVFTFRPTEEVDIKPHRGVITKNSKMHYSYNSEYINIKNIELAHSNIEELAATLYSSMLLRHGVDIKYIIKTAKKVNENITSFSSAMCRILSKYLKDGETGEICPECGGKIIRQGGCLGCQSCGYSKCG